MKANCISLALHLLSGALESTPGDPVLLNELGVAFLKLDRFFKHDMIRRVGLILIVFVEKKML
jgi:hypothetical protein